jgi:anti-sigma regulatory factor (Ser/Thr protein kinase)
MQELSLNILDVAQNSIAAGASLVEISIQRQSGPRQPMTIVIGDNGRGMDEETVRRVTDPFYTTRTTRRVGLGVPLFQMAAQMTGGDFSIRSRVGEGTTVTATVYTGHIDAMPLGDMAATMTSLIQTCPQVDFVYTYGVDGRSFTMDTRAFKEVLEGVEINSPQVVLFIRDYIVENTAEVEGKASEQ